ncbi:MAG: GNAT family N-acetyltransferase [Nocardioidaceae bacterium]
MEIRTATSEDWPTIFPFFRRIVDEGRTYAFPPGLTEESAIPWWMEEPPGQTVVATDAGEILGSAKMGPNRPGPGSHVATASFMVDPDQQGRGVGTALGGYVVEWGRSHGYHAMQFNAVVESNAVAVSLWQSLGFEILATVPESFAHPDHGLVGLHVMYKKF